jgi:hypothetical protein
MRRSPSSDALAFAPPRPILRSSASALALVNGDGWRDSDSDSPSSSGMDVDEVRGLLRPSAACGAAHPRRGGAGGAPEARLRCGPGARRNRSRRRYAHPLATRLAPTGAR